MQWIVLLAFVRIAHGFQSAQFTVSAAGMGFRSANTIEDLSTSLIIRNVISCATLCLRDVQCRTFEFDAQSQTCRLFEGSTDTGTLLSTGSATTVVGSINVEPSMFYMYNATSDQCVDNRFLSNNDPSGLCQCSMNTFWNGSMCLNQRYAGDVCVNSHWCRSDLALSCNGFVCKTEQNISRATSNIITSGTITTTVIITAEGTTVLSSTTSATTTLSTLTSTTTFSTTTTTTSGTTTTTRTTTTTSVTIITAPPPCVPQASLNGTLYRVTNPTASMSAYTCFAYTWIATGLTATLSFFFRHDPSNWRLDEVKVYHGFTQLITNGGFENGFDNWTLVGSCNIFSGSVPNSASNAKAGSYYYKSPCALYGQTLSQTFPTVIGDTYVISFWLINDGCCGTTVIANITVS